MNTDLTPVRIGPSEKVHAPLGLGTWSFGANQWSGQEDANLLGAMEAALDHGITHFDSATDYGDGYSERLIGRFLAADPRRRERLFLATKANLDELTSQRMLAAIDDSRARLQTDMIDLYYIHWPRTGQDMRPVMEGLELARQQGKIKAIGVSNFSVEQMMQVAEVGRIDAHQLGYNLVWRFSERDLIPYCIANDIAIVTYSSIAHGILAGRFTRQLNLPPGDQRHGILLFREDVWPFVYEGVEQFKRVAQEAGVHLIHLAIRWLLHQPGITTVLVGARNASQAEFNAQALQCEIPASVFDELSRISDSVMQNIPDEGNPFGYHP